VRISRKLFDWSLLPVLNSGPFTRLTATAAAEAEGSTVQLFFVLQIKIMCLPTPSSEHGGTDSFQTPTSHKPKIQFGSYYNICYIPFLTGRWHLRCFKKHSACQFHHTANL